METCQTKDVCNKCSDTATSLISLSCKHILCERCIIPFSKHEIKNRMYEKYNLDNQIKIFLIIDNEYCSCPICITIESYAAFMPNLNNLQKILKMIALSEIKARMDEKMADIMISEYRRKKVSYIEPFK